MSALPTIERTRFLRQPCGCLNFIDPEWGVERSYSKCAFHKSESGHSGLKHHEVMGAIKDGAVQYEPYISELKDGLREMDWPFQLHDRVLEIGCGVGSYDPVWISIAASYVGLEPDAALAQFHGGKGGLILYQTYESFKPEKADYDVIFCAHAFEHMEDSPGMMAKAFSQLKPGGRLVLIVPNDEDKCNPDHLWFWNETGLRSALMKIGFNDIRIAIRQRVKHEKFIYATALRP